MRAAANSSRYKVLMTADAVGGVWNYALDLVRELSPYGVEVLLAVMGPAPDALQQRAAAEVENLHLIHKPFALEWYRAVSPADIDRSAAWLREQVAEFKAELVHLNGYAQAAYDLGAPALVVAHSCVFSWWNAVHGEPPPAEYSGYRSRLVAGLERAAAVVAPSRWMLATLRNTYGLKLTAAATIPNFTSVPSSIDAKEPVIFASGRFWDPAKNIALLDGIAHQLGWPVEVAGETTSPEGSFTQPGNVRLLGKLSSQAIGNALARAAIFAHPARYEPFGLSVLEAARNRCALVLADIPSLRELWEGCAVFVPPTDPDAWAGALNRLSTADDEREQLAQKAQARSLEFHGDATARAYLNLYQRLGRNNARRRSELHESSSQDLLPLHRV